MDTPSRRVAAAALALLAAAPLTAQDKGAKPAEQAPAASGEKHLLRYRFLPGTTWRSVISQRGENRLGEGDSGAAMVMTMRLSVTNEVRDAGGGRAFLDTRITRVEVDADTPIGKLVYDSDDKTSPAPEPLAGMAKLVGQQHTMIVTDRGEVISSKLRAEVPDDVREKGVDIEQVLSQSVVPLPEQPVAIGAEWQTEQPMELGQLGSAHSTVTHRLTAIADDEISIAQKVELATGKLKLPADVKLGEVEIGGEYRIDLRSGLPRQMRMQSKMTLRARIPMTSVLVATIEPAAAKDGDSKR